MIYLELFWSFVLIGFTSFGGMSMLPLITSQMTSHGWMTAREVTDIIAIAEMTPGPLGLNCATFAGSRTAGIPGAIVAGLGVVVPSLTIAMVAAMGLQKFKENTLMRNALYGIRPVCIGMLFAIIVRQSISNYSGSFWIGISWPAILIGVVAAILLIVLKWDVPKTILVSAVLGLILG